MNFYLQEFFICFMDFFSILLPGYKIVTKQAPRRRPNPSHKGNRTDNRFNLSYCPYASLAKELLPCLKVAALYFDQLIIFNPVGPSSATVGSNHYDRDPVSQLKDAGIPRRLCRPGTSGPLTVRT